MSTIKLEPCPFCGAKAKIEPSFGSHYVTCTGCGISVGIKSTEDFEPDPSRWNRRAQPAEEVQPVGMFYQDLAGLYHQLQAAVVKHYPDDPGRTPLYTRPPAADADRLDAERYRWLRNESWAGYNVSKGKPQVFETVTMVLDGARNFKTILAEEALDAAIDAALAASKEKKE